MYIDILIHSETEAEHLKSLEEVFKRLAKAELKVKKQKCKFMVPTVPYLGHIIDSEGLHPLPEKVEAIHQAPTPNNVTELKSYLGLLTYYGKFFAELIDSTSTVLQASKQERTVGMDIRTRQSVQRIEGVTHVLAITHSLRLETFVTYGLRCVCLRHWRNSGSPNARQFREVDWVCLLYLEFR